MTGTWRTVDVDVTGPAATGGPASAAAPLKFDIDTITFADDGRYTATTSGPQRTTFTGTYRFRLTSLTLTPAGNEPVTYGASVRAAQLRLTRRIDDGGLSVTLSRVEPQ